MFAGCGGDARHARDHPLTADRRSLAAVDGIRCFFRCAVEIDLSICCAVDSRLRCIDIASLIMARRAEWRRSQSRRRSPPRRKRRARPRSGRVHARRRRNAASREASSTRRLRRIQSAGLPRGAQCTAATSPAQVDGGGVGEIEARLSQVRSQPTAKSVSCAQIAASKPRAAAVKRRVTLRRTVRPTPYGAATELVFADRHRFSIISPTLPINPRKSTCFCQDGRADRACFFCSMHRLRAEPRVSGPPRV
jgi:hypothetical protein